MLDNIAIGNTKMFLYLLPVILLALFIIWRSSRHTILSKIILTLSYTTLFIVLTAVIADISIETFTPQQEQASLTILYDNSNSMQEHNINISNIVDQIQLKTTLQTITSGLTSPINGKVSGSLYQNGQFLLITDGYPTDGDDLTQIAESAVSFNATIHTLDLDAFKNDASVVLFGPSKTFVGTSNTYVARVNGNNKISGTLAVYLDGEEIYTTTDLEIDHSVPITFSDESTHQISAKLLVDDLITQNNNYYITTRIIPKPKVLYIGQEPDIKTFAEEIFDVTKVTVPPLDMEQYSAIIMGNARLTDIEAAPIESFVSEGGGLAVFGGNDAYDYGQYDAHNLATLLPVEKGRGGGKQKAIVVIALDISASTDAEFSQVSANKAIEIQKALAYSIVEQLGDDNIVGIIAFNTEAYVVSDLVPLSISRKTVLDKITRIQMQGNTRINIGLGAAYELLKDEVGTSAIVLISDGLYGGSDDGPKTRSLAKKLSTKNIKLFPVGVGSHIDEAFLRQLATDTNGIFLRPGETDRLAIQFGEIEESLARKPTYSFIIDSFNHPITFGLDHPSAQLNNINQVIPKTGAKVLVKTTQGDPALTVWNYGLGRVASWTAFEGISDQKEFIGSDSYLFGRILTWGAGDPEIKNPPLFVIEDTTLGKQAKVRANSESLQQLAINLNTTTQELAQLNLEKIDETLFDGEITSRNVGFRTLFGQSFATNYAPEIAHIGQSPAVANLAKITGGQVLSVEELSNFTVTTANNNLKIKTQKSLQRELTIAALIILLIHIVIGKLIQNKKRRNKNRK